MPTKPIFFGPAQESGSEALAGAASSARNVVIDARGVVRRRPGLTEAVGRYSGVVGSGEVTGLHETDGSVLYATVGPRIYRIGPSSAVELVGDDSTFGGSERPHFAETETLLVIAAGQNMHKVVLATHESSALGGDPPQATHVIANSLRLLANDGVLDRTKVRYSDISQGALDYSGHELWTFGGVGISGFFTAEARPDPVVAIGENTNEVFVWGTSNVQIFAPDGQSVYAPASTREYGCSAPYSIVKVDQEFAWLDHQHRFVLSDGRNYKAISDAIQQDLDDLARAGKVGDCFGYRVRTGPADVLVWTLPSAGVTYAYQVGGGWSQWQSYGEFGPSQFTVTAHHYAKTTGQNLVGTSDGHLAELAMGVTTDLGEPLVASVQTGYLDRETSKKKWCTAVRFTLRRGQTSGSTAPVGLLRYSDRPGQWSAPMPISLGVSGDTESTVELRSLGVYTRRAWRWEFSGDVDLALVRVDEDYEVLEA